MSKNYATPGGLNRKEFSSIHKWIKYKYGVAKLCEDENCSHVSKRFEWALRKGFYYKRDRGCFIQLCKRCHIKYDNHKPEKLYSLRDGDCMARINNAKFKKVEQYSLQGDLIKLWNSGTEAGETLQINRNCIGVAIKRGGTYKKYIWRFPLPPSPPIQQPKI